MAYELIKNGNTEFAIDWTVVRRLLKSYWLAYFQNDLGKLVTVSDSHLYNPFSWSLPKVSYVELDWVTIKQMALSNTESELQNYQQMATYNVPRVATLLSERLEDAAMYKNRLLTSMQTINIRNNQNLEKAIGNYESNIEVAKFIRDTSAETVLAGASVMSGGAAVAFMAGGSAMKGAATYQDTDSIAGGIMEGFGSFTFGCIKLGSIGKNFSFKGDMVLALVKGSWKTGTELVSGASLNKALVSGGLKLTGPFVDKLFKTGLAKKIFDKVTLPIEITYDTDPKFKVPELIAKTVAKLVQRNVVEKGGKSYLVPHSHKQEVFQRLDTDQSTILNDVTLTDKLLVSLSLVNMEKGIGNGW